MAHDADAHDDAAHASDGNAHDANRIPSHDKPAISHSSFTKWPSHDEKASSDIPMYKLLVNPNVVFDSIFLNLVLCRTPARHPPSPSHFSSRHWLHSK